MSTNTLLFQYQGVLDLIQELKKFDEFEYVRPNYILEVDCN